MRLRTSRDEQQVAISPRFGLQGCTRFALAALMATLPGLDCFMPLSQLVLILLLLLVLMRWEGCTGCLGLSLVF